MFPSKEKPIESGGVRGEAIFVGKVVSSSRRKIKKRGETLGEGLRDPGPRKTSMAGEDGKGKGRPFKQDRHLGGGKKKKPIKKNKNGV